MKPTLRVGLFRRILVLLPAAALTGAFAADHNVTIHNFSFDPDTVTIDPGDRVIWTNQDGFTHTTTSDAIPPVWNSGGISGGNSFSFTFSTAGTFTYHCEIHSTMHGTVIVKAAENKPPTVTLASPGAGALFLVPATINLTAKAADADGSVTNVEFFDGATSLGHATADPFTISAGGFTQGFHTLTARATDDKGTSSDSAPVKVLVTTYNAYSVHGLVSDLAGMADNLDPNLVNPWGIVAGPATPFWISDGGTGLSTVYDGMGMAKPLIVQVDVPAGVPPPSKPTGIVFNSGTVFEVTAGKPARFIFATENGTICAWQTGTNAVVEVDNSGSETIYKGLALASAAAGPRLYAADFHHGKVDVFDGTFQPVALVDGFKDATLPAGYAPFNIVPFHGNLLVSYALQDDDAEDDAAGPGHGFINLFDTDGKLLKRFSSQGPLNSPWGMVQAPAGFGEFSGALLVGNFGNGRVNAFNADTGEFLEALESDEGGELQIEGLWGLTFGNGGAGGDAARLYFTAGISGGGEIESHGLFGVISAVPTIEIEEFELEEGQLKLTWVGGLPPFKVQRRHDTITGAWVDEVTTSDSTATVPMTGNAGFFRVSDSSAAVGALGRRAAREVWCRAPQ